MCINYLCLFILPRSSSVILFICSSVFIFFFFRLTYLCNLVKFAYWSFLSTSFFTTPDYSFIQSFFSDLSCHFYIAVLLHASIYLLGCLYPGQSLLVGSLIVCPPTCPCCSIYKQLTPTFLLHCLCQRRTHTHTHRTQHAESL